MSDLSLSHLALSESGFLFDTRTGSTYTLNRTGTAILRALIAGGDLGRAAEQLHTHFEATPEMAARDAELFVRRLRDLDLIDAR